MAAVIICKAVKHVAIVDDTHIKEESLKQTRTLQSEAPKLRRKKRGFPRQQCSWKSWSAPVEYNYWAKSLRINCISSICREKD